MFIIALVDPDKAVIGGENFGRDSDTIAGMAGLLSGKSRVSKGSTGDYTRKSSRLMDLTLSTTQTNSRSRVPDFSHKSPTITFYVKLETVI